MTLDIANYSAVNEEFIKSWHLRNKGSPRDTVSLMAVATGVPCIVVAIWLGNLLDWPTEIIDTVNTFTKFYGYTKIYNSPKSTPIELVQCIKRQEGSV